MIFPSYENVVSLANQYSIIPVCKEIYSDVTTPINLLRKLTTISSKYFLLESVEGGEKWGRYSFLGYNPTMRITCKDETVSITKDGITTEIKTQKPFDVLREISSNYKAPTLENIPPFAGGFVGYFGYSMIKYAEPKLKIKQGEFNDFDMMLFDKVIAIDHQRQKICVIANINTSNLDENYNTQKILHIILYIYY